jgi:hypothetical protein
MDTYDGTPGANGYFRVLSTSELNELTSHAGEAHSSPLRLLASDRLSARRAAAALGDAMHDVIFVVGGIEYRAQLVKAHPKTVRYGKNHAKKKGANIAAYVRLVRAGARGGR